MADVPTLSEPVQPAAKRAAADPKFLLGKYGTVAIFVLIILVFSILRPKFLTVSDFADILVSTSIMFFISLGVMSSLVVNGFDVSIGSIASLASMVAAGLMVLHKAPLWIAIVVPLAVGAAVGLVNALFIVRFKMPDLLVTLGMMFAVDGIQQTYSNGENIYPQMALSSGKTAPGTFWPGFNYIANGKLFGVPFPIILTVIIGAVMFYLFEKTRWGRQFYATGDNPEASRIAGIPVHRYRAFAYVLSGVLAAVGGLVLASLLGSGENEAGAPYLLNAVTATYMGFSVWGMNRANVVGTFVGALFLSVLLTGLTMLNVPYTAQNIFQGGLLILAIAFTAFSNRKRQA
ncbi:ABC transporter permease [Alicyclobacillus cycloheptanicus]|uniref:Simple sugar transport system permease protein n=1 Tax=Alicyclobacillus cycloheptanicus TaxID=1457 RepID=A0ABT9XFJ4_9BACL|nr:ABC transporter permease [Alicyclobacillus cycloheptanicus]MDQ0189070.1 simple sugar transport system permease protein [Alicyclobacillus cycloheptanicus]WDM00206.1 ABC transporter permease [Alicyclobacillus cycloheptanicus]